MTITFIFHFIIFDVMVSGIVFLISLSDSVYIYIYTHTRLLYIKILYLATLPSSLMSSSSFLVVFEGGGEFSMYNRALSHLQTMQFYFFFST